MEGAAGLSESSAASPEAPLSSSGATSNFWEDVEDKFSLEGAQRLKKLFGQGKTRPVIQIIGAPAVGEQLATAGDLSGFRTKRDGRLMCKFQWLRAPTELAKQAMTSATDDMGFVPIAQARKPRYCPQQSDVGYILKVEVTPQMGDEPSAQARNKLSAIAGPVMSSPLGSKDIAIGHRREEQLLSSSGPVKSPMATISPASVGEASVAAQRATPMTATSTARPESVAGSVAGSVGLHAELERWQQRASRLVAEKADAEEDCRQAKMELAELKAKEERWTERYENWKTEVQAQVKAAAHAAWEVEKSEMQEEMRSLKSDVAGEREQLLAEQRGAAERQAAIDRAMEDIARRKAEIAEVVRDLEARQASVSDESKSLQTERSSCEAEVATARRLLEAERAEWRAQAAVARAEAEADRKSVREELQAAARMRKEAESQLAEAARHRDDTLAGEREAARAEALRAAQADVQSLKSQASEQLARERSAFEAELAASRRQLEAERTSLQAEKDVVEKEAAAVRSSIKAERAELETLKESQQRANQAAGAELDRQKGELAKDRQRLAAEREELEGVAARLSEEVDQHEEASRQAAAKREQAEHERETQLRDFRDMRHEFEREKERLRRETEAAKQEFKKTAVRGQEALEAAEWELDQKRLAMEDEVAELRVEAQALQQAARAERQAAREQSELERSGMEAERKRLEAERRSLVDLRHRLDAERGELEIVEESQSKALAANMAELQLSSNSLSRQQSEQAREKRALEADRKELERRAQQIKEERLALEDMRSRTYSEMDTMRSELGQVQVEHSRALDEREAVAQRHAELKSLYKRKEDELDEERRRWDRQLRDLEATKAELIEDRRKLQDELVAYAEVVGSLEGQVKVWEQRWSQEQNAWELERQTVLRKIDDLMTERCSDAKTNAQLEGELAARDSRSGQLEEQLRAAQREIQSLAPKRARQPAHQREVSAREASLAPSLESPASSAPRQSSASPPSHQPLRLRGGLMASPSSRGSPAASLQHFDGQFQADESEPPSAAGTPASVRPPGTAVSESETDGEAIQALLSAEAAAYAAVAQLAGPHGSSSSSGSASGPQHQQRSAATEASAQPLQPNEASSDTPSSAAVRTSSNESTGAQAAPGASWGHGASGQPQQQLARDSEEPSGSISLLVSELKPDESHAQPPMRPEPSSSAAAAQQQPLQLSGKWPEVPEGQGPEGGARQLGVGADFGDEIQRLRLEVAQLRAQAAVRPPSHVSNGSSDRSGSYHKWWAGGRSHVMLEEFDSLSREDLQMRLQELLHEVDDLESAKAEMDRFLIQVAAEWEAAKARYDSDQSSMLHDRQKLQRLETKLSEERKDLLEEVGHLKLTEASLRAQLEEVRAVESDCHRKADRLAAERKKLKAELSNLKAERRAERERLASEAQRSSHVLEGEMEAWKTQEHKWEARRQKWKVKKATLRELVQKLQADAEKSDADLKTLRSHSEEKEVAMEKALRACKDEEVALKSQLERLQAALLQEVEKASQAELETARLRAIPPPSEAVAQGPVLHALRADLQQLQDLHSGISDDMRLLQQMMSPNFWAIIAAVAQGKAGQPLGHGAAEVEELPAPQGLQPILEEPAEDGIARLDARGDCEQATGAGMPPGSPAVPQVSISDVQLWPRAAITPKPDEVADPGRIGTAPQPPPGSVPSWEFLLEKYNGKSHIWGPSAQVLLADERTVGSQNALLLRQQWVEGQLRSGKPAAPLEQPDRRNGNPTASSAQSNHTFPTKTADSEPKLIEGGDLLAVHFPCEM